MSLIFSGLRVYPSLFCCAVRGLFLASAGVRPPLASPRIRFNTLWVGLWAAAAFTLPLPPHSLLRIYALSGGAVRCCCLHPFSAASFAFAHQCPFGGAVRCWRGFCSNLAIARVKKT